MSFQVHLLLPVHEEMNEALKDMALRCYGYGRWDAPYWFIGPEQGQVSNDEKLNRLGITHRRTAYHHPEGNSYIERFHRSLKDLSGEHYMSDLRHPATS